MAAPAGGHGDASRVDQRSLLLGTEDQVFSVAIAAHWGPGHSVFHRLSVHAFEVRLANLRVALPARSRDIPVVNFGPRIFRRQNSMAAVTIGAACGSAISGHDGSSMHTL